MPVPILIVRFPPLGKRGLLLLFPPGLRENIAAIEATGKDVLNHCISISSPGSILLDHLHGSVFEGSNVAECH